MATELQLAFTRADGDKVVETIPDVDFVPTVGDLVLAAGQKGYVRERLFDFGPKRIAYLTLAPDRS